MTTYNVGDRIIMTRAASGAYSITKEGSTGTIVACYSDDSYSVDFDYLPNGNDLQAFGVASKYFKLLIPVEILSPAEAIAKKIKLMWGRQKYAKSQQAMV